MLFSLLILDLSILQLFILDDNSLNKREKYFGSLLIWRYKIIQNCLKIDATHKYDNDLLLRQETKKNCISWKVIY